MGWLDVLDIGLGVANLATNSKNAQTLSQMRMQGATEVLIQAFIKEMRNQIFHLKQTADTIMTAESKTPPKISAGAMKLLELRLNNSGITPDLFHELGDKDYAATTIKVIRENSSRLMLGLSPEEKTQVEEVVSAAYHLPDYDYYVSTYDDVKKYREALPIYQELKGRQMNGCVIGGLVFTTLLLFVPFAGSGISAIIGERGGFVGSLIALVLWIIALWYLFKFRRANEFADAKNVVDGIQNKVDLDSFSKLENGLGTNKNRVITLQSKARSTVQKFFGDEQTTSLLGNVGSPGSQAG